MIFTCPFCNAKAVLNASDCPSCGKKMTRNCPDCAETVAANATVCKYCGEALPALKEPVRPQGHPGIVFIEETKTRKKCCAGGRGLFWLIVLALAGFCVYAGVKSKQARISEPAKQQISYPKDLH